jgi:hypothetical protein
MDKLSKEELLALLAKSTDKPRKERKKPDLSEEKKIAMLERLAVMREKVKENREKKKSLVVDDVKVKERDIDEVFEKKYGSKFEKMADLLTDLNENTKEVVKMKKEKIAKREAVKLEIKEEEIKPTPVVSTPTVAEPAPKPHIIQSHAPNPQEYSIPNRNVFRKGNTRW